MRMITATGTISNYASYISNCTKSQFPYKIPVNSLDDVQLFIDIGTVKPTTVTYELIHTCGALNGTIETLTPSNYVIGQDKCNSWYGVFKNFVSSGGPQCFVIAITIDTQLYFSEEYCIEPSCKPLTQIKGCYGNLDPLLSRDCDEIYFGYHSGTGDPLGDTTIRYEHKLLIREAEVSLSAIKNSFKQGRTRNFRTEKEKIFQFFAEFIPEWYLSEIDAVFYRGEVYIGATKYLVNETEFEKIEDCKRIWKPSATLKESCYQSFSCEADPCAAPVAVCCDPVIISIDVTQVEEESIFVESGSQIVVIQSVVGGTPDVTGTFEAVTGIADGSFVVTSDAFINKRVYVERGNIFNPGIDPQDGSQWHTKVFSNNFVTFNTALVEGEFLYIETIT